MKNTLKKAIAGISAVTMLAVAMPVANAFAEEESAFVTKTVDGGVVITDYTDLTAEKIVIPSELDGAAVVGVDAFAFGLCEDLATIVVPETLQEAYIDNNAFMTAPMLAKYVLPSDVNTVEGLLQYYAEMAGTTYTDDMLVKFMNHIKDVEIPNGATVSQLAILIGRDFENLGFSEANINQFNKYTNLIAYDLVTLEGPDGTEAQTYAAKKNTLKYVVTSGFAVGDVTMDGEVDVFDAIAVAQYSVGKRELDADQLALADMNDDDKVDVFDAIAIAKSI
ncbi:MAG: dockerin type I repeat-containing protein [Porcipelethomonas sp.]